MYFMKVLMCEAGIKIYCLIWDLFMFAPLWLADLHWVSTVLSLCHGHIQSETVSSTIYN